MAFMLTSGGIRREVARLGKNPLPLAITSGTALATTGLLKMVKPGGLKTLLSIGAFAGGGFFVAKSRDENVRALSMGIAGGGLWTLIMRT